MNLTDRRLTLEQAQGIDPAAYARHWRELAADYRNIGMPASAARCDERAAHYESTVTEPPCEIAHSCYFGQDGQCLRDGECYSTSDLAGLLERKS